MKGLLIQAIITTMNYDNFEIDNPFFSHDMDEICGICYRVQPNYTRCSLNKQITIDGVEILAYQVLESVSKFKFEAKGPQFLCSNCFLNTVSAFKFQQICNKAQLFVDKYLKHQTLLLEYDKASVQNNTEAIEENIAHERKVLNDPATKVQCKVCHKFTRQDNIKKHMLIHDAKYPYKCDQCEKSFNHPSTLRTHKYAHADTPGFVCKFCGKAFYNPSYLRFHEQRHTEERPYKCELCDLSFKGREELRQHATVHTVEKHFSCEVCAKSFKRKKALVLHHRSHTGDRRHACPLCSRTFLQKNGLTAHLRAHNNEKKCENIQEDSSIDFQTKIMDKLL